MIHLVPFILIVPIALVSVASIVVTTLKDNKVQPQPSPIVSQTPTPTPTPTLSPSPTPTPKPPPTSAPQTQSTGTTTSTGNYTVLTYDLGSTTVVTDTANDNDCGNDCPTKPLAQHISDNGGRAGMNGTYFCPPDYANCAGKVNSFDFPVFNNRQKEWINADKLFWDGRGMMLFRPGSAQFHSCAKCADVTSDITGGIVNYPSLLSGGNVLVEDGAKGTRSGIGYGSGKLFLVVARNVSFMDLANIFKNLGATDALNLDGGGSVALYDGGYKAGPGRSLPNAVIIR